MALSAPTKPVWIIAVVLGVLGMVGHFQSIQYISQNNFFLLAGGFLLLAIGSAVKGL